MFRDGTAGVHLKRAFTKRTKSPEILMPTTSPLRTMSLRKPGEPSIRNKISSPVALVSTTNMLSYSAPNVDTLNKSSSSVNVDAFPKPSNRSVSSASSASSARSFHTSSGEDSDGTVATSIHSSDRESVPSSPVECSPEPNHLTEYFRPQSPKQNGLKRASSAASTYHRRTESQTTNGLLDAPVIPKRALSHSKRAHERLARKRSLQLVSTPTSLHSRVRSHGSLETFSTSISYLGSSAPNNSLTSLGGSVMAEHPFGKELEQLNEVAEELHGVVKDITAEEDNLVIKQFGLGTFDVSEYMMDVEACYEEVFGEIMGGKPQLSGWF